jgi:hypothetical protein
LYLKDVILRFVTTNYNTFVGLLTVLEGIVSGSAESEERDLGRDAETHRKAESSEAAIHIESSF